MKAFYFLMLLSCYCSSSYANFQCADLFDSAEPDLIQMNTDLYERLTQEFSKGKTLSEALEFRDKTAVPEFRADLLATVDALEVMLGRIEVERNAVPNSFYSTLLPKDFFELRDILRTHIDQGKALLEKDALLYKETIFYIYKSSLAFSFVSSRDLKKISRKNFYIVPQRKILDFLEYAPMYDDAIIYARLIKDDITENFLYLDHILNEPVTVLYFVRELPSEKTVARVSNLGIVYLPVNEMLFRDLDKEKYPSYLLTQDKITRAHHYTEEKMKMLDQIAGKKPKASDYKRYFDVIKPQLEVE